MEIVVTDDVAEPAAKDRSGPNPVLVVGVRDHRARGPAARVRALGDDGGRRLAASPRCSNR
jgi:hypothetical protein